MEPGTVTELQGRYVIVLFDSGKVRRCNGLQVQFDPDEATIRERRDAVKAKWSAEELEKRSGFPAVKFEFPWYVTRE